METQLSKSKKASSQTMVVRQTIQSNLLEGIVDIPVSLRNRLVEMIILPLDSYPKNKKKERSSSLKRFAGAWVGEKLVRQDQGEYEVRKKLL